MIEGRFINFMMILCHRVRREQERTARIGVYQASSAVRLMDKKPLVYEAFMAPKQKEEMFSDCVRRMIDWNFFVHVVSFLATVELITGH